MLPQLAAAASVLLVTACSSSPNTDDSPTPSPAKPSVNQAEMLQKAEAAVKGALPDAPIWQGMAFEATTVDASTVCVDRTFREGGGLDGKGGSAGYVLVTFPALSMGEPTEGACSDVSGAPAAEASPTVSVPDSVAKEPGLITRTDLGKEWPLTVDYGVMACENKTAGGQRLQVATLAAPDGKVYALNGTAKSHSDAADIDPIWAPDPDTQGLKIGIGPLIQRAISLC